MDTRKTKPPCRKPRPTRNQARAAVSQWLDLVRSNISAIVDTLDRTYDELRKDRSPIDGLLDLGQVADLLREMRDAEFAANCLTTPNPLDLNIESPLALAERIVRPAPRAVTHTNGQAK